VLVGRESESQSIARLVAEARIGNSGVVVLTGEPGVGKTALLEYAGSLLEGFRVLRAAGVETETEVPFAGLLQLLRPALDRLDEIPEPQAAALSAALALREGSPGDRFSVGAGTLSLLCRYAEDGPVAIVVDDLQVVDAPSVEALVFAARRLQADPIVVLLAARAPDVDEQVAGLPRLQLPGLGLDAARELLSTVGVPEDQLRALHRATAGNPLALQELGDAPELLALVTPELPLAVPARVTEAFSRRVRQLAPAARAVLLVAAVAGEDLSTTTRACSGLGLEPSALGGAEDAGLVALREGRVQFRHPLVRAAVYAGASAEDRRATHRAVADALPAGEGDRRAWHLSEAVWVPDESVASLLVDAAERAVARSGFSVASTAYERASRLSPSDGAQTHRLLMAAEAAWSAGQARRADALLAELRLTNADPVTGARARELQGTIAARTGSLRAALDLLVQAADLAVRPDDSVVLLADAVYAAFYLGDTTTSLALAERLSELTQSATTDRTRALSLMATGIARVLAGAGGIREIRAAVPLLEGSDELRTDPRHLPWLILAPLFLRDADSGAALRGVVDQVRANAGVGSLPNVLMLVGRDQATTSSWRPAEANYSEAIRLARETGQTTELAMSLAGLCWLESRQGNADACREHAREALAICGDRDIHLGEAWSRYAVGDLELSLGNAEAAVDELVGLGSLLDRHGMGDADLSARPELVEALLRLGQDKQARVCADEFEVVARAKGRPWAMARACRALGLVAADDEVDRWFAEARSWHEQTLDRFELGRTLLAYGGRLRRAGRRVDARGLLREALDVFGGLGARQWADQAASELTATGATVQHSAEGWEPTLTPQELQVSLLLAEGRTTRETAAALFLSPKTVEYHLRKVYNKLGIRSRAELAAMVAELDSVSE
jgi:DNA-binding CsgD family transcriptional regulator